MSTLTRLFEPGRIGKVEVKNRIVMAPMVTRSSDGEGHVTDRTIAYYEARAKGGVGLIVSQAVEAVRESHIPKALWIHDDSFIPKLRELTGAVHKHGSKIFMQILQRGILAPSARNAFNRPLGTDVVMPSAIPYEAGGIMPREATKEDIQRYVEDLSEAARRARDAGFDGVEFHGAHGYFISAFLSPFSNRRTDEYGGSVENRTRFAREILTRSRKKVGADFALTIRMSGSDYLPGGMDLADTTKQAPLLVAAGADALHVSASGRYSQEWQFLNYTFESGAIVNLAEAIKKVVDVPVTTVGKIGDPRLAERILEEGRADFVALGRALLADPDWANKARAGRFDEICYCLYCNNCTHHEAGKGDLATLRCTVNPALLREEEYVITPAPVRKKVMVVGGGLAGMEAARVMSERGHTVTLYEKSDSLGGQWSIAGRQEDKRDFGKLITRLSRDMESAGVQVKLGQEVTRSLVEELKPDAVVVATGANPKSPDVPGAGGPNVVQANDVIMGRREVGQRVVVIGGRSLGMEIAYSLAQQGKNVSLVTRRDLGRGIERNIYHTLRDRLIEARVPFYPNSPLREIRDDGVYVVNNNDILFLPADSVVLAVGSESERGLAQELAGTGTTIRVIGDAVEPRNALEAIHEGAEAGRLI